ncbi:uncharacterized protein LOC142660967 isoform X2 [Rhinoderma darwinii]|uniref:uncharacterized protein LOC142660967 isoform X2 n=1 Tax=Rhinoderma darwinii TaxID=43563 RepID=UPI003F66A016
MIHIIMKPILCAALLAMILHPTECRRYDGDYGGPSEERPNYQDQKASQGGIMDQLSGLGQSLGLPNLLGKGNKGPLQGGLQEALSGLTQMLGLNPDQLSGLFQKLISSPGNMQEKLSGLAQNFGLSGGLQDQLLGVFQKFGSSLGSGGGKKGSLQGGPREKPGKAQRFGSSSGGQGELQNKFGSYGEGAGMDRNGYGPEYGGKPEESGRVGRPGSRRGKKDRNSGYKRQEQDYESYT